MSLHVLYYVLWIAPVPVFVYLATMMIQRKLHREFPLFFAFVIFQIADFGVGFSTYHLSQDLYFYAFWTMSAISIGIGFGVLYEVFTALFRPFADLRELGGVLFRWAAVVLSAAALLMAFSSAQFPSTRIVAVILNAVRSVEIMQCGLVLLMLLCSSYLGITVRHRIFGIAFGFGIMAAVDLIIVAVFANLGLQSYTFAQLSKMGIYNLSALCWVGYMYRGRVQRKPTKQFSLADRWDYALAAAVNPASHSPSLPLIEDAVERLWKQASEQSGGGNNPPKTQ